MFTRRRRPEAAAHNREAVGDGVPRRIGDVVGGYRIIRRLGESERSVVYLGHAGDDEVPGHGVRTPEVRTVAIKVFRPEVQTAHIDRQIEAISRAAHPHVVALRDLATVDGDQPCLVLERLPLGSLATLLAGRPALRSGEAVTILAPIAAAIDVLHTSGVVHRGIRASSVLFRQSGAPVLASFGVATVSAIASSGGRTAAALAVDRGVLDDRASLAQLARLVLGGNPTADPLREWLDHERAVGFPDSFGAELAERLFALAIPEPVRFDGTVFNGSVFVRTVASDGIPARLTAVVAVAPRLEKSAHPDGNASPPTLPGWVAALHLPDWIDAALRAAFAQPAVARLLCHLAAVRARYWVGTVVVVAGLAAAAALVPSESPAGDVEAHPNPAAIETPASFDSGPVAGDDPAAALEVLLALRNDCVRDLSIVCLDDALQQGSAAMEHDVALIRSLQAGGELPGHALITAPGIALVERLGDTALLDLGSTDPGRIATEPAAPDSNPASALVSRGEAGWRIRGYVE